MQLKSYQADAVRWFAQHRFKGILADDMGLGKTRTACATLATARVGPVLICCPASAVGVWEAELRHWPGLARACRVVSYDRVARLPAGTRLPYRALVADEAHELRNPDSKRTRTLLAQRWEVVLLLTGTPLLNGADDARPLLDLIGDGRDFGDAVLRRTKAETLSLPPKRRIEHELVLDPEGQGAYERAKEEVARLVAQGLKRRRLREACTLARRYNRAGLEGRQAVIRACAEVNVPVDLDQLATLRGAALGVLRRALGELAAPGVAAWAVATARLEPIVVFTAHLAPLRLIASACASQRLPVAVITGATSTPQRTEIVRRFQSGQIRVLLCTMAGYAGITLTRSRIVAFAERWWVPGWEAQGEDRVHRIGQTRPVEIHRFRLPGTVDDHVVGILDHKQEIVEGLVQQDAVATAVGRGVRSVSRAVARRLDAPAPNVVVTPSEVAAALTARQAKRGGRGTKAPRRRRA